VQSIEGSSDNESLSSCNCFPGSTPTKTYRKRARSTAGAFFFLIGARTGLGHLFRSRAQVHGDLKLLSQELKVCADEIVICGGFTS
jgi:hypothetical protein